MKKLFTAGLFVLALAAAEAGAGQAFVRFGPPPPPREVMFARPGPGYVWIPGAYRWNRGRYHWTRGYWAQPPRARAVWVPGYWTPRRGGYAWVGGFWR